VLMVLTSRLARPPQRRDSSNRDTIRHAKNDMKEVLTKRFWQGVRKTFHDALEGPPVEDNASQAPDEGNLKASSPSEIPSSPSVPSDKI
jgi:hypothetical protein